MYRHALAGSAGRLRRLENTHRRFCRWRDKIIWEKLLETFCDEPELAWLMIDVSHIKTSSWDRCEGWEPGNGPHKRGLNTKLHLALDAHGRPVRARLTAGTIADCSQALLLLKELDIGFLLADKDYDTNEILGICQGTRHYSRNPTKEQPQFKENMTKNGISSVILLRMLSCISNVGGALPLVMRKAQILSLPLSIFVACSCYFLCAYIS